LTVRRYVVGVGDDAGFLLEAFDEARVAGVVWGSTFSATSRSMPGW